MFLIVNKNYGQKNLTAVIGGNLLDKMTKIKLTIHNQNENWGYGDSVQ